MVPEAMRAAWILKQEYGYETRVLNLHTLKPIDAEADRARGARDGRSGHRRRASDRRARLARQLDSATQARELYGMPVITGAIGVKDRFGESGAPWELVKELEVSAEHIAQKAMELVAVKKAARDEEATGARFVTA